MSAYVPCEECGVTYDNGGRHTCNPSDVAVHMSSQRDEAREEALEDAAQCCETMAEFEDESAGVLREAAERIRAL